MTTTPGFPRRGIPVPRPLLPPRPAPAPPFFRTAAGRRILLYGLGLVALVGTMVSGVNRREQAAQGGAESRPVALTRPPRHFVPTDLLHQLRTIQDMTPEPPEGAIATAIGFLSGKGAAASRPASEFTDLAIEESLEHPAQFRGGLVRVRGLLAGIETLTIKHPAIPDPDGLTYRGWLYCKVPGGEAMVTWQSGVMPPDVEKETLVEVEGVFLQASEYESQKGTMRRSPFLVVSSVRTVSPTEAKGILDSLFVPILVSLIILILVTTLFLLRRSRRPPTQPSFQVRPPGQGS